MPTAELDEPGVADETKYLDSKRSVTPTPPRIPQELLAKFVGPVLNLYKIDQILVSHTKYRINVWQKIVEENAVVPRFVIFESYYVDYSSKTKKIKDETDRRVISLDGGLCDASLETNCCGTRDAKKPASGPRSKAV